MLVGSRNTNVEKAREENSEILNKDTQQKLCLSAQTVFVFTINILLWSIFCINTVYVLATHKNLYGSSYEGY